jgi:hypothetical protein
VTPLEPQLQALGRELDFPADRDLTAGVLKQLSLSEKRPFPWRRAAVLAFALVAIAIATAFAVPQARTAILRFFHLGGATVIRVDTLPPAVERRAGDLGTPMSRPEAERRVGYRLLLPHFEGPEPRRVYVVGDSLASVFVRWRGHRVLLSEFPSFGGQSLKKLAYRGTIIDPVEVNGRAGLWIEGGQHTLAYFDRDFGFRERPILINENVLLWVRGQLTLRIEGKLSEAQALELARTIR